MIADASHNISSLQNRQVTSIGNPRRSTAPGCRRATVSSHRPSGARARTGPPCKTRDRGQLQRRTAAGSRGVRLSRSCMVKRANSTSRQQQRETRKLRRSGRRDRGFQVALLAAAILATTLRPIYVDFDSRQESLEQIRTTPHRASGESARQNNGLERDRTAKLIQSAPIAL